MEPLRFEAQVTYENVDPEVLRLLTGQDPDGTPATYCSIEVWKPIRRTWWQWLLRRPKQFAYFLVPNARILPDD